MDMQTKRVVLALAVSIGCGFAAPSAVSAEEYRGTWEQQMACTPDVWRLCGDRVPDVNRIVACLRQKVPQLSSGCRAVIAANEDAPQPRGRAIERPRPAPRANPYYRYEPYDDDDE
jgi:hypothetical protein